MFWPCYRSFDKTSEEKMKALKITMTDGRVFVYRGNVTLDVAAVELVVLPDVPPKPLATFLGSADIFAQNPLSTDDAAAVGIKSP